MSDNKDYGSGGKSNSNISYGKHNFFCATTSGMEDVVFQPQSSAAHFKNNNDRLADHVGVTFRQMGPVMGKDMRKLVQPVLAVPSMTNSESKSYDAKIIVFADTYKIANQDIRKFKDANQRSYSLYKQNCAESMIQKLTTFPDWETVEEDMDGFGLAKILRQVCHNKRSGGKQQMLNLVQATKDNFMCWQQRGLVGMYHERFLATLKVAEEVDSMIGRDVATANIVLEEWGLDTANPGSTTKEKREAAFGEGENHFRADMFSLAYRTTNTEN